MLKITTPIITSNMKINTLDKYTSGFKRVLEFDDINEFKNIRDQIAEEVNGDWSSLILRFLPKIENLCDNDLRYDLSNLFENCDVKFYPTIEILGDDLTDLDLSNLFKNTNLIMAESIPVNLVRRFSSYFKSDIGTSGVKITYNTFLRLYKTLKKACDFKFSIVDVSEEEYDRISMPLFNIEPWVYHKIVGKNIQLTAYVDFNILRLNLYFSFNEYLNEDMTKVSKSDYEKVFSYKFNSISEMTDFIQNVDLFELSQTEENNENN